MRGLTETRDKEGGTKGGHNTGLELEESESDIATKEKRSRTNDCNKE